jgi:hypothetical protein
VLHLNSICPVPDLAVLLFATDLEHTPLPLPQPAAAGAASSDGDAAAAAEQPAAAAGPAEADGNSSAADNDDADDEDASPEDGPDVEGLTFVNRGAAETVADSQADSAQPAEASRRGPAEAVLLGGYARYKLKRSSDLAALLQLREHMQLLLQMKVRVMSRCSYAMLPALCIAGWHHAPDAFVMRLVAAAGCMMKRQPRQRHVPLAIPCLFTTAQAATWVTHAHSVFEWHMHITLPHTPAVAAFQRGPPSLDCNCV